MDEIDSPKSDNRFLKLEVPIGFTSENDLELELARSRVKTVALSLGARNLDAERFDAPITSYLIHLAYLGCRRRYPVILPEIRERLDYELAAIIILDCVGYFLIVADIINRIKDKGSLVGPGRGAIAGSVVAFSLRITDIDPLEYRLHFERFLNLEKAPFLELSLDICFDEGLDVLSNFVLDKYTDFICSVTNDESTIQEIYLSFFDTPTREVDPELLSDDRLKELGIFKIACHDSKALNRIKRTINFMKERGIEIRLGEIPLDDELTFRLLREGKIDLLSENHSPAMNDILKKLEPESIEDLTALNALSLFGWMDNSALLHFIEAKTDQGHVRYPLPGLESILRETHGVIVYQEQLMEIIQRIGGYSLARADCLRRKMSKKNAAILSRERPLFLAGAKNNGIPQEDAERIFDLLLIAVDHAGQRSHASAQAVLSYRAAYLDAHYSTD